jgi:hypothetical protein
MVAAIFLIVIAIAALLVPDLRAEVWTWIVAAALIAAAVLSIALGRPTVTLVTSRQLKYRRGGGWGFTSHDGAGGRDVREKRAD